MTDRRFDRFDRCANFNCRTSIDLEWSAVICDCQSVACCLACDPIDACTDCRTDRELDREMEAACEAERLAGVEG